MRSRILRFLLPALAGFALAAPFAVAQSIGNTASFSISVSPQYPAPQSAVTLTPLSSTLDLANATMSVTVNGKSVYSGNAQPTSITVGAAGALTSVRVMIASAGSTYSQSLSLRPQDVALVVEPLASAPALYPGKPLVPLGGSVRVVAVAGLIASGGKAIDPAALSYSWTVDGTQIGSASGIGKDAMNVPSPLEYRSRTVLVVVQSQDGSEVGGASLTLEPEQPVVRLYENDPLLGIRFGHALANVFAIPGAEVSLYGAPYSFPTTNGAPALQWFLNGAAAQTGNVITLRPTGSGQGSASLSFVGSAGTAAEATVNLSLSFGAQPSSGFFGL
ncbi:MAG TPA: hypothetical protein VMV50_02400 [Candidatus Paceibacterota bacterium]|nr:hypothetical protein [Candidatus Paceibacterota bacterium]